jgi:cytochrome P450
MTNPTIMHAAPAHVPPALVRDFDFYHPPGLGEEGTLDLHHLWKDVQDSYPRIFWTPHHGGHWIISRYADIQAMLLDPATFSNAEPFLPRGVIPFQTPVQLDPPDHGPFRKLLMPAFMPASLARATDRARRAAIEIIAALAPQGRCEFVGDFAGVMPIIAFLTLINLPIDDFAYLRGIAVKMGNPTNPEAGQAWADMSAYVLRQIEQRRAAPQDDFISSVIAGTVGGRPLSDEEVFSMCLLIVGGGLDTVVSMTSLAASYLAQHPQARQQLRERPELIDNAVEEIARRFGTSNLARLVRADTQIAGVPVRAGDIVLALFPCAGLDETVNADPMTLDFARARPRHLAFGTGPHTCIGNRLAKREIRIFLEEWLPRIPDFRLARGTLPQVHTGLVNSVARLDLEWDM